LFYLYNVAFFLRADDATSQLEVGTLSVLSTDFRGVPLCLEPFSLTSANLARPVLCELDDCVHNTGASLLFTAVIYFQGFSQSSNCLSRDTSERLEVRVSAESHEPVANRNRVQASNCHLRIPVNCYPRMSRSFAVFSELVSELGRMGSTDHWSNTDRLELYGLYKQVVNHQGGTAHPIISEESLTQLHPVGNNGGCLQATTGMASPRSPNEVVGVVKGQR
jgi:hypothetical protein